MGISLVTRDVIRAKGYSAATRSIMMLSVCAVICVILAAFMWGVDMAPLPKYFVGLFLYAVLTAIFIVSRLQGKFLPVFEGPVFVSLLAFFQFGVLPLGNFFLHADELAPFVTEEGLIRAFPLCVIGMVAFWAGTAVVRRRIYTPPAFMNTRTDSEDGSRILMWAAFLFVCGATVQVLGVSSRVSASDDTTAVFGLLGQLSIFALLLVTIELYARRGKGWFIVAFWVILPVQCVLGFFSGMKGVVLVNIFAIAMITWICKRKAPLTLFVAAVIGAAALYPVMNSWRNNEASYGVAVNDTSSALSGARQAYKYADTDGQGLISSGAVLLVQRLDLLSAVAQVQELGPALDFLDTGSRVWMIPFYPFVPRVIWKDKPPLDQGRNFAILLGSDEGTSITLSYIGDANRLGGWPGALVAMFGWGMLLEALVQFLYRDFSRMRLFIYLSVVCVPTSPPMEGTIMGTWCGTLKQFVVVGVLALIIYGSSRRAKNRTLNGGLSLSN